MKKHTFDRVLPWITLLSAFVLSVSFYAAFGRHNLDSDMSSEIILADLLNEEGSVNTLSDNWLYSTELRLISPIAALRLGLLLFSSWWHARVFAVALMALLVMAASLFLAYSLGLRKTAPWFAMVLMLPINHWYEAISLFGIFYSMHVVLSFVTLGFVICYMNGRSAKLCLPVLAAFGMWGGVNGVRMLTMLHVPMAAAAVLGAVWTIKDYENTREAVRTPPFRAFVAVMVMAFSSAVGFLANTAVLNQRYSVVEYGDMAIERFTLESMLNQISGVIEFFGYDAGVKLFSLRGISSCIGLVIVGLICFAVARLLMRRHEIDEAKRFLVSTALWALLVGMVFNVILDMVIARYFLIALLLLVLVIFVFLETEPCRNAFLGRITILAVVSLFAFQAQDVMHYDYKMNDVNYEVAEQWLQERGYTQGYATFWNANILTEVSDGEIEMWSLPDSDTGWKSLRLYPWLQKRAHIENRPQGRVFLLLDESEYRENEHTMLKDHYVDMIAWSYYIFEFESADQLYAVMGR